MSPGRPEDPVEGLVEGIVDRGEQTAAKPGDAFELLTFLFADIRGYTKFTQDRGDEAAAKLTAKFAMIVRALVAQSGGTVLELRGDEVLCVFNSPRQSLRVAVALQQRFVDETVDDADLPMCVGVGIDAGEVVRGQDGYRGGALNLAARLCALAKAGEVLASPEVTHLARTIDGLRYVVLDRVALKGLSDPVRPVRVLPEGEDPARQLAALLSAATPRATAGRPLRWMPRALATRARMTVAGAGAVVVVVAGVLVVVAVDHGSGGRSLHELGENSLGTIDPRTGRLVGQVGVDDGPVAAAAGFGSVWTVNADANTVSRVDTSSRQVRTVNVGTTPSAIAVGPNAVWVANSGSATVSRIDPTTYVSQTIAVGAAPGGVAVAGGSVWVTNTGDGTVSRIDPSQNRAVQLIEVGDSPTGISAGRDVWVANSAASTVSRIDGSGRTHAVTQTIPVGNNPKGIAVVGDQVWVTNNLDGTVSRISTTGTTGAETVRVGLHPTQIAAVDGHLWVSAQATGTIAEIDPAALRVIRTLPVGAIPGGLAQAGGKLWVATTIDRTRHRGGTVHVLGGDVESIDVTYPGGVDRAALLSGSYDGLVGFRRATGADGTAIVPDLAAAIPDPTNGGRTYTFQLRNGVHWSTGQPITVFDVRRGLERTIVAGFVPLKQEIVGASACRPVRCDVTGIAVDAASRTVTVTLVRPDGNFLDNLAVGMFAVPAATPLAEQKTRPIPATGPYQVARYVPGKLVVLTRNRFFREWSAAAQPAGFPDRIEWRIGPADIETRSKLATDDVTAGRTDWADARGAAPLGTLEARFGSRLHVTPTESLHGLSLNTRIPPFNDPRVRRALALAIDRDAIAGDWFTPAAVTCQFLPPNYPGYRPYCPYTLRPDAAGTWKAPDVTTAQRLVRQSRVRGMTVTVYALPTSATGLGRVVTTLRDLGYRARLSVYTKPDYFEHMTDSRNKVQAAFYGWVTEDASAANLLNSYECDAYTPASRDNLNPAEFCDRSIDRLMSRAVRVQVSSPAAANALWAQVDRRFVDSAPWIPLVTPSWVDVISARVHNYQRSPVLGVFFDQMWVR